MTDYLEATAGLPITRTIYMEVDVGPRQHDQEAELALGMCERNDNPMAAAVIGARPASPDFEAYIARHSVSPHLKGVRQVLHNEGTPRGFCLHPRFVRGVRLLGEKGLRFDLCMRSEELADAARLASLCADTTLILDHCGNPSVDSLDLEGWKQDIAYVAERINVVCKISGIVASARRGEWTAADLAPIIEHTSQVFGPDRILFGSDWPVCTLSATCGAWVRALQEIVQSWPEAHRRKLFHANAERIYQLAPEPADAE
jgi:L-fuconolactonase